MVPKSAIPILRLALAAASDVLPPYSCPKSPHKFTQPQLFGCLVLKTLYRLDYRELASVLASSSELREALGLKSVPHFTTLAKAADRLLSSQKMQALLTRVLQSARRAKLISSPIALAAIDSSGFDASHASTYFVKRQAKTSRPQRLSCPTYPTLAVIADCRSHLILAALPGIGPWPEARLLPSLVRQATRRISIATLLGDKAYDSEENHRVARETFGVKRTIIPPIDREGRGRRPSGRYRRENTYHFRRRIYHQRWQVESVFSSLKRRLGSTLSGRTALRRSHDLLLKVVVFDLAIVPS